MNSVSVVMVSYYTGAPLWLAIEAVLEQPECHELLLVDNGNPPGVQARLAEWAGREPRIRLITGQGNIGFSKACNKGARAATGDYILLLNPDSMLPEGGLARALEVLKAWPENTLAGCFLANPDGSEQRGSRRALLTPENAITESLGLGRLGGKGNRLNLHGTDMPVQAHEVPAISGAFMFMPRSFYERLGGLDEGYFLHMEDMDLCYRVHEECGKVICMPEVKVMHFRSTSQVSSRVVERHKARSFVRYLKTHFAGTHSAFFLQCMALGIYLRYCLGAINSWVDAVFVPPLAAKREIARMVLLYRLTRFGPRDESLADKTVLVTGGSGQTGLCVIGKALARGARVIAIYNRTGIAFSHPNLMWVQRDLDKSQLAIKADAVINTTALWQLPDRLADIIEAGNTRVIAFGSTSMFAKFDSKNLHERGVVERLKAAEDTIAKTADQKRCNITILRPTMIYGVGLDFNITRLANVIQRFGVLAVYGRASGLRQPVQALDLADAALDVIDNPVTFGKSYNLGGSQMIPYRTMITLLYQYLGKKPRILRLAFLPAAMDVLGKIYQLSHVNGEMARRMNQDVKFDIHEAIIDFGYRPKGFLQGDVTL